LHTWNVVKPRNIVALIVITAGGIGIGITYKGDNTNNRSFNSAIEEVDVVNGSASSTLSLPVGDEESIYHINTEDVLHIAVSDEPDLERRVKVQPDGSIRYSFIGKIQVSGLTPLEVKGEVSTRLMRYVQNPEVIVSVE